MRRIYAFVVLIMTLLASALLTFPSLQANMIPGIEFKGGFEILYEIAPKAGSNSNVTLEDLVASAAETIVRRVDIAGVKNPQVAIEGDNRVRVTVAASSEEAAQSIRDLIESDADISFRDINDEDLTGGLQLLEDGGATLDYQNGKPVVALRIANTDLFAQITSRISNYEQGQNRIVIWLGFEEGVDSYQASQSNPSIADKIISDASVTQTINSSSAIIEGSFTAQEAQKLANAIRAGTIDFELTPISVNTIGASYGASAFNASLFAGIIGLIAVIIFVLSLYRVGGVIAGTTLLVFVVVSIVIFNMMKGEFGPDTIAATVISIGMAVDSSIIFFERFKDEAYKGRNLKRAFEEGRSKSMSTIVDANVTTLIAALVLYFFGTRTVKGFATMLVVSIVVTMVIIVFLSEFLFGILAKSKVMQKHIAWLGVNPKAIPDVSKNEISVRKGFFRDKDYMKMAKPVLAGSGVLLLIGALFFGGNALLGNGGFNLGLNFSQGTRIIISSQNVDMDSREEVLAFFQNTEGLGVTPDNIIVGTATSGTSGTEFTTISVQFKQDLTATQQSIVNTEFGEFVDPNGILIFSYEIVSVSPIVAQQTVYNAMWAVLLASLMIIIYTIIRFSASMATGAIIALVHDAAFIMAFFAIFRMEVNIEFVSAILAIIGYSINDTIVTFDRLRENIEESKIKELSHNDRINLANRSLQETLGRSFVTFLTTMLTVTALFVFGSDASRNFNIAMLIGLVAGTSSSVFLAPYVWVYLEDFFQKRRLAGKHDKKHTKRKSTEPEEVVFIGLND